MCKLIFESNAMEGAGLPEGETRNLIDEYFPRLPDSYDAFSSAWRANEGKLFLVDGFGGLDKDGYFKILSERLHRFVEPQMMFGEMRRSRDEVLKHALAYEDMRRVAFRSAVQVLARSYQEDRPADAQEIFEGLQTAGVEDPAGPPMLLREEVLKELHKEISEGLLDESAKVAPGEYRQDTRMAGVQKVFMAHEHVPAAMERFCAEAARRFYDQEEQPLDLATWISHRFTLAAWISHRFVAIHPFPDFNGRISRLLLAGVLLASGVPFAVSIKATKVGRKRYLEALHKADKGNLEPYMVLIARSIVESFQEIDANLALAGLGSIRDWDPENEARATEQSDATESQRD